MTTRATSSLYWPGITADIAATRNKCAACNSNASSQAAMPPTTPEQPEYPFQHICADFFHHEGAAHLVLVDRYSGWPIVFSATNGAMGLAHTLRDTFAMFDPRRWVDQSLFPTQPGSCSAAGASSTA